MKKFFQQPEIDVIRFDTEDVIYASENNGLSFDDDDISGNTDPDGEVDASGTLTNSSTNSLNS